MHHSGLKVLGSLLTWYVGQVFSLLAEYGDDDEDEGDEEKEDEHQEDLSHQDLMKVDDKPVTPPQEARGSAHDHDQGMWKLFRSS